MENSFVEKLEINKFSDSHSRVGRDNSFFEELEITSKSTDKYLNDLLPKLLHHFYDKIENRRGIFYIGLSHEFAYSPTTPRTKLPFDSTELIKLIQTAMAMNYDREEHCSQNITYNSGKTEIKMPKWGWGS